jgi:hypothetical protein
VTEEEDKSEVVDQLRDTVTALSNELEQGQAQNAAIASKLWESCLAQDKWVAMMNILRQETEGILHRRNVLLESDVALERLAAKELARKGQTKTTDPGWTGRVWSLRKSPRRRHQPAKRTKPMMGGQRGQSGRRGV